MSKNLHNNEQYLQNLSNQGSKVPPAPVWDQIEAELDAGSKSKPLLPWMWIGGLSLLVLTSGFWLVNNTTPVEESVQRGVNQALETTEKVLSTKAIDNNAKPINKKETAQLIDANLSTNEQKTQKVKKPQQRQKATQPIIPNENLPKPRSSTKAWVQIDENNTSPQKTDRPIIQQAPPSDQIFQQGSTAIKPILIDKDGMRLDEKRKSEKSNIDTSNSDKLILSTGGEEMPVGLNRLINPFSVDKVQPNFDHRLIPHVEFALDNSPVIRQVSPWFIEASGGIGREVASPDVINNTLGNYRIDTEDKWYAWSSAFHIGYQLENNWYGKLGIEVNQTKDKFDYFRKDVTTVIMDSTNSFNHQIVKGDEWSIGEIRYTYLDLSLQIGYRQALGKSVLSMEGGPIFNTQLMAQGKVRIGDREISKMEEQDYFKSNIGIGGRFSVMFDYPLNEHLWLSFGPTYHQYFEGISSESNSLDQRSAVIQARMRLRYNF